MSTGNSHTVFESAGEIDSEAWDALRGDDDALFMDRRLLAAVERSMPEETQCWYVLFRDAGGRPVCTAVLSSYVLDATSLAEGFGATLARWASVVVPSLRKLKVIFLGMPFSAGQNHLRFADDADRAAIVRVLDRLLCEKAKAFGAKCIIAKEFGPPDLERMAPFLDCGYRRADSLPMNYMKVEHGSYDEFCAALDSRRRRKIRSSRRKFSAGGLRFEICRGNEAAERFSADVHQLYLAVVARSKIQVERQSADFFRELCLNLPDNAEIVYALQRDRIVAFGLLLFSETVFVPLYLGLDYETNREFELYFNMFFESTDRGLKSGVDTIVMGQTADDGKHHRFRTYQEPLYLFVKGTSLTAKVALRFCFSALFPNHELTYARPTHAD